MFKKIAAASVLLAASSAGFAAEPGTFYAGGSIGSTKFTDADGRDFGYGAFVGYNFHPNLAVELGHRRLLDRDYRFGGESTNLRINDTSLSLVGTMPIGERFSVFGRLGATRVQERYSSGGFTGKDSTTKALYGVGLSYAITPAVTARVEVQKISQHATKLSTGLSFQF